jgi:glycosyltransferase involved in cell wall biosynthesis
LKGGGEAIFDDVLNENDSPSEARLNGKIRVLHLIAPAQFGGAERVLLGLAERICADRFQISIGSFVNARFRDNEFLDILKRRNIPGATFWLRRTFDFENIPRIARFIRRKEIDILHTHGYRSDVMGLLAAKITGRPVVSTLHGWVPIDSKLRIYERVDKLALFFFDRIIAVSEEIRQSLRAAGVPARKIIKLHNAIRIEENADGNGGEGVRKGRGEFRIGMIGRLSPEKNVGSFLRTASLLGKKHSQLKFVIAGDGPERGRLEKLSAELGLVPKVTFMGFVKDPEPIYRSLDLLVIASSTEGIPLVLLEAMKHSVPVISTKVGGVPEVVTSGVDGILIDGDDPRILGEAVETLLADREKHAAIARNAREKIFRSFNQETWIGEIEKIYEQIMKQRERR